jgi:hypothetical protein
MTEDRFKTTDCSYVIMFGPMFSSFIVREGLQSSATEISESLLEKLEDLSILKP